MRNQIKTLILTILTFLYISSAQAAIVINEIYTHGNPDWIELYNSGGSSVNIGGYYLSDDPAVLNKWFFPAGTTISANGYLIVYAAGDNATDLPVAGALNTNFKIKQEGEKITLSTPTLVQVDAVNPVNMLTYGSMGVSWARIPNFTGAFQAFQTPTRGRSNAAPIFPPPADDIIINEVMGNNKKTLRSSIIDPTDGRDGFYDWIELYNKGAASKSLTGYKIVYFGTDFWTFPVGTTIPANGYLVIFASGKNTVVGSEIHTNFKLNTLLAQAPPAPANTPVGGVELTLRRANNNNIDYAFVSGMSADRSIGRLPNGTGNLINLTVPSPGSTNANSSGSINSVVINEVASNETQDWIELYNTSASPVNLGGAYLTDDLLNPTKWQIPGQTIIPGNGYKVFQVSGLDKLVYDINDEITEIHTNFSLKNDGTEGVRLTSSDSTYSNQINAGLLSMSAGQSLSRIGDGTANLVLVNSQTKGTFNLNLNITPPPFASDIVINEVVSYNTLNTGLSLATYPGGDKKDWIELYNKGTQTVNVKGMMLQTADAIWMIPPTTDRFMAPGSYLLIFASGLNLTGSELHTNFTLDNGVTSSLFLLNTNRSILQTVSLPNLGYDQSYARIPNGTGTFILDSVPTPAAANNNSPVTPNAIAASNIVINEILSNNVNSLGLNLVSNPGTAKQDWIEIYNKGGSTVDLYQLKLADANTSWVFPPNTLLNPGQYLLVYVVGSSFINTNPGILTANFAISASGENVQLLNRDNSVIQTTSLTTLPEDVSYGRLPNGTGVFKNFAVPTPGSANADAIPNAGASNIIINEVVSNNLSNLNLNLTSFPGGASQDYIELYNKGGSSVNLQGLKLTDSKTSWVFPSVIMPSGGYLLVFASGRDLKGSELHTNFSISSTQGEVIKLLNIDNSTVETSTVPPMNIDESFSRLPNGTGNPVIVTQPSPLAANINNALTPNPDAVNITINEIVANNANNISLNLSTYPLAAGEDWIELYNKGSIPVDMVGLKLQDSSGNTWVFPSRVINPGQYLFVSASGLNLKGSELHTNFSISSTSGEIINFLNKDNSPIQSVTVPALNADDSYSRIPNGTGNFAVVVQPTPLTPNNNSPLSPNPDAAFLSINEIVTNNVSNPGLSTHPGAAKGWIELRNNNASVTVNVQGLKLASTTNTWVLPNLNIAPGGYLLVFASGLNLTGAELHTNFTISETTGDIIKLLNKNNALVQSVIVGSLNADEAFARLPNGTGVMTVVNQPSPAAVNINSPVAPNADASNIVINEVVSDNVNNVGLSLAAYPGGSQQDWIELYNKGSVAVDLQGLKLTDKSNNTWVFPSRILNPGQYIVVFTSGNNLVGSELHTNFSLSSSRGDTVRFLNKNNTQIQSIDLPFLDVDEAYARMPDGTGALKTVTQPTPGATNATSTIVTPNPLHAYIAMNEILPNNVNNVNLSLATYPGGAGKGWVELYNRGTQSVDVQGLKLIRAGALFGDDYDAWSMPSRVIPPGGYLLVFTSGFDLKGSELHTNFVMSSTNNQEIFATANKGTDRYTFLGLYVFGTAPQDVSVALIPNGGSSLVYATSPTPGSSNTPPAPSPLMSAVSQLRWKIAGDIVGSSVTTDPKGYYCATITGYPACQQYQTGETVKLVPSVVYPQSRFAGWSLPSCAAPTECNVNLTIPDLSMTAYFADAAQLLDFKNGDQLTSSQAQMNIDWGKNLNQVRLTVSASTGKVIYDSGTTMEHTFNVTGLPTKGENLTVKIYSQSKDTDQWLTPMTYTLKAFYDTTSCLENPSSKYGLVTMCLKGRTIRIPLYLRPLYLKLGATDCACLVVSK